MKPKTFNCEFCGSFIVRKDDGRKHFCDRKCKGDWQKLAKPVTKEWLEQKYLVEKLDSTQIGHIVNRDPKSVWNWLKDFKIPTRPRGGFTCPKSFKKGEPNRFKGRKHSQETRNRLSAIAKADGRVPFKKEIGPPLRGKFGPRHPNWKGGLTPERQALYCSQEWSRVVKIIWRRDSAKCQRCGLKKQDAGGVSFDIHHIKGFEHKELRCEPSNLVLLCEPCHYFIHSKNNTTNLFICR